MVMLATRYRLTHLEPSPKVSSSTCAMQCRIAEELTTAVFILGDICRVIRLEDFTRQFTTRLVSLRTGIERSLSIATCSLMS